MFDESKIGEGELPEVPSRGDDMVKKPEEGGIPADGQIDEVRRAAQDEEALPVVGGEQIRPTTETVKAPEAEKPFNYEAEKAEQEDRYLRLMELIVETFKIKDAGNGDFTRTTPFIEAVNDWKYITKIRGDGMSEENLAAYYKPGEVELARRASLLLEVRKDIKAKLEAIEAKKAEQDLVGVNGADKEFDQEISKI